MNIFIISDTHFGHSALADRLNARPGNFENKIVENWERMIWKEDMVIHLGDVALGTTVADYRSIINGLPGRKILCKGNHDKNSYHWYMQNGFDFCCEHFHWEMFGLKLILSHEPVAIDNGRYDLNIHGHLHSEDRHGGMKTNKAFLVSLENTNYMPLKLSSVIASWKRA